MAKRILVVEDDEKSRRLLKDVLEYHGFEVCAHANGEDGLADARSCSPDAVLLDIELPGISGFAVLAGLRAESGGEARPVIAVTATTGMRSRSGQERNSASTSKPLMPGSWMSRSAASGRRVRARSSPSSPLSTAATS